MTGTEQAFGETTALLEAVWHSMTSEAFPDRSVRDTLLVAFVYAAVFLSLPFAIGADLANLLAHW
ncbi:hypothetical protein [Natronococcus occultus]|uniref:Uncharacterized protein n=1 Tax=Natronococcus occultus SP4 TaxID=694430 RepID=L0JW96_9EURY|nr:hypothetical protein [Natronococcus occultus]AGB36364.1 hypothetical protein Natoc_0502 [Natronococcus occultus SP4]